MNFNNYTIKSQEAIQQAQQIAQGFDHQQIENAHILKALFEIDENVLPFLLKKFGVNKTIFVKTLDSILQSFVKVQGGEIMFSRQAGKTLNDAANIAKKMKDEYISVEHLLLAMLIAKDDVSQLIERIPRGSASGYRGKFENLRFS
jgi:ATP-dependent Clp protease ATP-binding subunit ClpB